MKRLLIGLFALSLFGCFEDSGSSSSSSSAPAQTAPNNPVEPPHPCREHFVKRVSSSGTATYNAVQDALQEANSGDQILVGVGSYNEVISIKNKSNIIFKSDCQAQIQGL